MQFIREFVKPEDCIIGREFEGHSQRIPKSVENGTKVNLVSKAKCCIDKEAEAETIREKKRKLEARSLNPHDCLGDYITGREIHVKSAGIKKCRQKPDPLAKKKKRGKVHRIHISEICCNGLFAVGFIASNAFLSSKVSLEHRSRIEKEIKLI